MATNPHLAQVNPTSQPQPKPSVKQQQNPAIQNTQQKTFSNTQTTIVSGKEQTAQVAPKFIELPKIDPNSQQLFSLNTITNQITQLSPGLTTAALGPMERLLIVPAGINAQQLAQCLLQGQIHFNNIGQAAQAPIPSSQQSQQPIQQPLQNVQHQSMQSNQQPPLQPSNTGSLPTKKGPPAVENKARKAKPRAKKTEAVKPVQQVVQPLPKTNQLDIKSLNQIDMQKTSVANPPRPPSTSSFSSQSSSVPPIQFNNPHTTNGPQQNVQIVRPSIQQPNASALARTVVNNNHQVLSTGPSNPGQRMTLNQQRPTTQLQSNQMQLQMNHHHLSNGPTMSSASMSAVPPLVSVHPIPQQHLGGSQSQQSNQPRVQTIQLTPQKQQLLKNVQMQIQSLSARLQNKSLLSTLTIPPDFDLNNPIHNKPLPMLSNMNAMSDTEIHQALQRLFIEQQKILATGKVIAPINNTQPSFASGPINTQPSTATAKPAIQYGQAPTSNTLPTKPSAVVPTTTVKAKPKSRAKAKVDANKGTNPTPVAPQITTPTLVNRPAIIRMATPSSVSPSEQTKSLAPNNAMMHQTNQTYMQQNTTIGHQPAALLNNLQQQQSTVSANQVVVANMPRMGQPTSLTVVPATVNIANSSIRQQAPSQLTMTLQPVVPSGVVFQQHSQSQVTLQPTNIPQKQQLPPTKVSLQVKAQNLQQHAPIRPALSVSTVMSSGQLPMLQQQQHQVVQSVLQTANDQQTSEQPNSQSSSQPQLSTPSQNQQPDESSHQHSLDANKSPATSIPNTHEAPPASSSGDSQPTPSPMVEHQPPASPKMKVPRHCL